MSEWADFLQCISLPLQFTVFISGKQCCYYCNICLLIASIIFNIINIQIEYMKNIHMHVHVHAHERTHTHTSRYAFGLKKRHQKRTAHNQPCGLLSISPPCWLQTSNAALLLSVTIPFLPCNGLYNIIGRKRERRPWLFKKRKAKVIKCILWTERKNINTLWLYCT